MNIARLGHRCGSRGDAQAGCRKVDTYNIGLAIDVAKRLGGFSEAAAHVENIFRATLLFLDQVGEAFMQVPVSRQQRCR